MNWKEVSIKDVVQFYTDIRLLRRGKELWALCPFHNEKTPSFSVNLDKNIWHCFGCGHGGSSVDFLMRLRKVDFKSAAVKIEEDFNLKNVKWNEKNSILLKTANQLQYEREQRINETIHQIFSWCFEARRTIIAELRIRGEDFPANMIHDLGWIDCVLEEIASADSERVATGIVLFYRRKNIGKSSGRSIETA